MNAKRPALGRGLTSLMTQIAPEDASQRELPVGSLAPNRHQPRTYFDEHALEELAESLRQHGMVQPIVARKVGDKFEIIAGERRWRAARKAGLAMVPVVLKEVPDDRLLEYHRHHGNAGPLSGPPTALACDDLELVAHLARHDGLDHAVQLETGRQILQRLFIEVDAGLVAVGHEAAHGKLAGVGILRRNLVHERRETPPQGGPFRDHRSPSRRAGSNWPSHSRARLR